MNVELVCPNCKNANGLLSVPIKISGKAIYDVFSKDVTQVTVDRSKGMEFDCQDDIECLACGFRSDEACFDGSWGEEIIQETVQEYRDKLVEKNNGN